MNDRELGKKTRESPSIRSLGEHHKERIATHLIGLEKHDRYLRFGYLATDEQIRRYVEGIDFQHDDVFGIFNRKLQMIAMAHLAYSIDKSFKACAEFGVSVSVHARGRGYGAMLFERAIIHARNEGVQMMFIHALTENAAMISIARKAKATIEMDGSDTNAYITLPSASFESQVAEIIEEKMAQIDYQIKVNTQHFLDFISRVKNAKSESSNVQGQ